MHNFFLLQIRYLKNAHQPAALYRLKAADILAANETELRTDEENCEYYSVCSTFDTNFAKTLSELTNLFLNIPLNMLQNTKWMSTLYIRGNYTYISLDGNLMQALVDYITYVRYKLSSKEDFFLLIILKKNAW